MYKFSCYGHWDCKTDFGYFWNFLSPGDKHPEQTTSKETLCWPSRFVTAEFRIKGRHCFVSRCNVNFLHCICSREHAIISELLFCTVNCIVMSIRPSVRTALQIIVGPSYNLQDILAVRFTTIISFVPPQHEFELWGV